MKTEMTGTGGGRWCRRAIAKNTRKKLRRQNSNTAVAEGLEEYDNEIYDDYDDEDDAWSQARDDSYWNCIWDKWNDPEHQLLRSIPNIFHSLINAARTQ